MAATLPYKKLATDIKYIFG